jgi:transcription-repair coupling factor (superfamily II helicase)
MSLRALLDTSFDDDRFGSLTGRLAAAGPADAAVEARVSVTLRPFLLAALLSDENALGGRPALLVAPDDRSARDLAADLRAYLAPRRVRFYPSRGTGYASHVAPPPHLVGLRIDALDALRSEAEPVVVWVGHWRRDRCLL